MRHSRDRNPNIIKVDKDDIFKINGKEFPVQLVTVDNNRLMYSFEAIARALYFHELKRSFNGDCKIVSTIFIHPDAKEWSNFNLRSAELIGKEQPNWGTEVKGDNSDIFNYQLSPVDEFGCQTLALTFYKATKVYVILSSMTQDEIEKVKPKFSTIIKSLFGDLDN